MKTREQYAAIAERLAGQANRFTYGDGADPVVGGALATEALVYATLASAAPAGPNALEPTVFRASYLEDGITLGTYRTREAAMDHVHHGLAREEDSTAQAIALRVIWRPDDPEADEPEWECWLHDEDGADDKATGYVVGPVTVSEAYDPDGEE